MRFGRRRSRRGPEPSVDPLPSYLAAIATMPVQCLAFDETGNLCVVAAIPLDGDELVELDITMSELPAHPPVSPASWLDQYLDRWHRGRFAGWRLRGEHAGNGRLAVIHPDLAGGHLRSAPPSAGVHVLGPYIRYGTGMSTGDRHVRIDHDQRCAELLSRRSVEAGVPLAQLAALEEHPASRGVAPPPLPSRADVAPPPVHRRPRRGPSLRTISQPGGIVSGIDPD